MPEGLNINPEAFIVDVINRVSRLETSYDELTLKNHEFDKELAGLKVDLKYIREGLDNTTGGINKLLWGMAAIFATYVVGFIVAGGLNIVGGVP